MALGFSPISAAPLAAPADAGFPLVIAPVGIASAEAFGSLTIFNVRQIVQPSGIPSAEAFGSPTVVNLLQIVQPTGIGSAEAFALPALRSLATVTPTGIPSAEAFGVPVIRRTGVAAAVPAFARWRPVVCINGNDVSAQLTGEIRIEVEEGAARIADFRLLVAAGTPIMLSGYVGKPVTIDYAEQAGDGSAVGPMRLFTGLIDLPEYDFASRTISFRCTDDLQGVVSEMARADVDRLLGAQSHYSEAVFELSADTWRYAQDRASTVAGSLDLAPDGTPRFCPWLSATTPDLEFTADDLLYDAAPSIALANRDQIRNRVEIAFAYRYPRLKQRAISASYSMPGGVGTSFIEYLQNGYWALTRDAVRSSLGGIGWSIVGGADGIVFEPLPPTRMYYTAHGDPIVWVNDAEATASLCLGFTATLAKAYAQTVEERYSITVEHAPSVAALGVLSDSMQASMAVDFDAAAWESSANAQPTGGGYIGYLTPPASPSLPSVSSGEVKADYSPSSKTDRAAADEALRTLVAAAQTRILAAHRQNAVSFSVALVPALDTDKTVEIATENIAARGKVRSVTHTMSLEDGSAVSAVELAICAVSGLGLVSSASPAEPPPAPDDPGAAVDAGYRCDISYGYRATDDHVLSITAPEIDSQSRDHYLPVIAQTYAAPLVEDLFEVTA